MKIGQRTMKTIIRSPTHRVEAQKDKSIMLDDSTSISSTWPRRVCVAALLHGCKRTSFLHVSQGELACSVCSVTSPSEPSTEVSGPLAYKDYKRP